MPGSDIQDNAALIYSCQRSVHCLNLVRSALITYEGLKYELKVSRADSLLCDVGIRTENL